MVVDITKIIMGSNVKQNRPQGGFNFGDTLMNIHIVQTGDFKTNSVVISSDGNCILFDPSGPASEWFYWLTAHQLKPIAIYITHGHFDHVMALAKLVEKFKIPWFIHKDDKIVINGNNLFSALFGGNKIEKPKTNPEELVNGSFVEIFPGISAEIIHTPGHTPGGICFYIQKLDLLISGDTLFANTIGRTDLPLGNSRKMLASLQHLLSRNLPKNTRVIPGHGQESTIGEIHHENPFFRP